MKIGVLAVQGAFAEHEKMLSDIGVESFEIRKKSDLECSMNGIILPGGESTVMGKLLRELDLFESMKKMIYNGIPVLGTCAGLILLAEEITDETTHHFGTLPVRVRRNAYGRQLGSFHKNSSINGIGEFPMTFIRAPFIEQCNNPNVEVLAEVDDNIVAVKDENQIGLSFHPEVTDDTRIHKMFAEMCSCH